MKSINKIVFLAILLLLILQLCAQCPIYGDKSNPKFMKLDSLKNRNFYGKVDPSITLNRILSPDQNYTSLQYVSIIGYVSLVKYGGPETCNCHDTAKNTLDIHIELALKPGASNTESMVVEINRYVRSAHPEYNLKNIKQYVGKQVRVEGWMFNDEEHFQNAVVTNPKGSHNWRYTCWEIHPVMKISLVQ